MQEKMKIDHPGGNSDSNFPKNFLLGTATSAFQIEGGGDTEWKGFIGTDGTKLNLAIDHYARVEEDLDYIMYLGNAYRFSMDWSKLQKGPYQDLDKDAVEHYRKIFKTLKENKKTVLLVLNHFANPLWFFNKGGWIVKEAVYIFADYAKKVLKNFAGYIDYLNTFNEPNAYANLTYIFKEFPPKKFNPILRNKVLSNMSEAHKLIYEFVKNNYHFIKVGISHSCMIIQPLSKKSIMQNLIKKFFDFYQMEHVHEFFIKKGQYVDYIGFSYYGRIPLAAFALLAYEERGRKLLDEMGLVHDDMWELYPEGIYEQIRFFYEKYKKPILITENGTCTNDDELRKQSLYNHLKYIKKATDCGFPVLGYFHWSTFDNFELAHGPSRRFGLTSVNFNSPKLERKIKESGHFYHKVVQSNSLVEP
jgi:beta-glucosidase